MTTEKNITMPAKDYASAVAEIEEILENYRALGAEFAARGIGARVYPQKDHPEVSKAHAEVKRNIHRVLYGDDPRVSKPALLSIPIVTSLGLLLGVYEGKLWGRGFTAEEEAAICLQRVMDGVKLVRWK